jgi:hypothetical protein
MKIGLEIHIFWLLAFVFQRSLGAKLVLNTDGKSLFYF